MANESQQLLELVLQYRLQGAEAVSAQQKTILDSFLSLKTSAKDANAELDKLNQNMKNAAQGPALMGAAADKYYKDLGAKMAASGDTLTQSFMQAVTKVPGPADPGGPLDPAKIKAFKKEMADVYGEMRGLRYAAMGLQQTGMLLTMGGGVLTAAALADAQNYAKTVGNITTASAEWSKYQHDIQQANLQIGETTMSAILPGMKLASSLMGDIADIVKSNPWIVSAALGVGSTMLVLGVAASLISRLVTIVADMGMAISRIAATSFGQSMGVDALASKLGLSPNTDKMILSSDAASASLDRLGFAANDAATATEEEATVKKTTGAAGGGLTLGTVMLIATSVILGLEVGTAIANALASVLEPELQKKYGAFNMSDALGAGLQITNGLVRDAASAFAKLVPATDSFMRGLAQGNAAMMKFFADSTGAKFTSNLLGDQWGLNTPKNNDTVTKQATDSFIAAQKQLAAAQETYSSQRADTITQYEQQVADVTAQYEQQRTDAITNSERQIANENATFAANQAIAARNFAQSQDKALRNYNDSVAKTERDFRTSERQRVIQHQQDMLKMQQEHDLKMGELAASRDALGLVKEQQSYAIKVADANTAYSTATWQARSAHVQQLADAKAAFDQQRADALAAYNQQQADAKAAHDRQVADQQAALKDQLAKLDANHKLEMAKLDQQEKDKLAKMDAAYQKQVNLIQTALVDQLNTMGFYIKGETEAYTAWMQQQARNFQTWLNNFQTSQVGVKVGGLSISAFTIPGLSGHQYGGYATVGGPGETGRPEFVMSGETTRMAESMIGGRLNQSNMLSAIMAGRGGIGAGGGGRSLYVSVQSRTLSITEIRQQIDQALNQKLGDLLPSFGV